MWTIPLFSQAQGFLTTWLVGQVGQYYSYASFEQAPTTVWSGTDGGSPYSVLESCCSLKGQSKQNPQQVENPFVCHYVELTKAERIKRTLPTAGWMDECMDVYPIRLVLTGGWTELEAEYIVLIIALFWN